MEICLIYEPYVVLVNSSFFFHLGGKTDTWDCFDAISNDYRLIGIEEYEAIFGQVLGDF